MFWLTKVNITKWTTPNLSSKPILVPHSQLHGCWSSLSSTETHVVNYNTHHSIPPWVSNLLKICFVFLWGRVKEAAPGAQSAARVLRQSQTCSTCHVLVWECCLSGTSWSETAVWLKPIHDWDREGEGWWPSYEQQNQGGKSETHTNTGHDCSRRSLGGGTADWGHRLWTTSSMRESRYLEREIRAVFL